MNVKKVVYFVCLLFASMITVAQPPIKNEHQCIDTSITAKRSIASSLPLAMSEDYRSDRSLYVEDVHAQAVLVDVREDRFDSPSVPLHINNGLKIPRHLLKTKSYLKNEMLILVGDGLDGQFLEREVESLQKAEFENVKILEGGMPALPKKNRFLREGFSEFDLHLISAERLFGLSIANANNFVFIDMNKEMSFFDGIPMAVQHVPYSKHRQFILQLHNKITYERANSPLIKVVFIHKQERVYKEIFSDERLSSFPNIWFMQGGEKALSKAHENRLSADIARNRVKVSCL
jgi:rhodanese-related sulfurtransferase